MDSLPATTHSSVEQLAPQASSAPQTPAHAPTHLRVRTADSRSSVFSPAHAAPPRVASASSFWSGTHDSIPAFSRRHTGLSLQNSDGSVPSTPRLSASPLGPIRTTKRMKSTMIDPTVKIDKPWVAERKKQLFIARLVTWGLVFIGLAGAGVKIYFDWINVPLDTQPLCLAFEDDFSNPDTVFGDNAKWFVEVDMSGYGNGQFEMTTNSRKNSYVQNGNLYITPTLTSDEIGEEALFDNHIYNITDCTYNTTRSSTYQTATGGQTSNPSPEDFDQKAYLRACSAVSNATTGAIINPVQSARLSTRTSGSIKYGRVEIRAKLPHGDWLWPALWMLPVNNEYGPWPMSGEIDIMESRGNGIRYTNRGSNYVQGSLHFGPLPYLNGVSKAYAYWSERRKSYADEFHTYVLEWTDKFMRAYIDTRLHTVLDIHMDKTFFERGQFPSVVQNGTDTFVLQDVWKGGSKSTPFDKEFYLIMNVAVGGTNGWFPDAQGDKPWLDRSQTAMRDFARGKNQWLPTWSTNAEDRSLVVDYVKMWKHC